MRSEKVVMVRCQEHDYDYRQWLEDVRIGYLLAVLEQENIEAQVFDFAMRPLLHKDEFDRAISQIADYNPRLVVFVVDKQPTNNPFYTSQFIRRIGRDKRISSAHITLYGNTTVDSKRLVAELPVDSLIIGEEREFCALVKAVIQHQSIESVPGLIYRKHPSIKSEIVSNPPLPLNFDLDGLPFPERYYFDLAPSTRHPYGYAAAILSSRGCYGRCTFCNLRSFENYYGCYPWRGRTPRNVVDEMEILYRDHDVREYVFVDSNFFGPGAKGQVHAQEFARELIARNLTDIAFSIYVRANDVRHDTFALLKQAGLYAAFVGIESFSQEVLDRYSKGTDVTENLQAIAILKELDVHVRMGFIMFDHHTTFQELRTNCRFLRHICQSKPELLIQPLFFQNVLVPLAGTPVAEEYSQLGVLQDNNGCDLPPLLAEQQRRRAQDGELVGFQDPRVAGVCETVRILSSILLQRSDEAERRVAELLGATKCDDSMDELRRFDSWISGLMAFAVDNLSALIDAFGSDTGLEPSDASDLVTEFLRSCEAYDRKHLGYALRPELDPELVVVD